MNRSTHLLQHAADFHGHLGPYLVLGLRMGLLAKTILEGDPFTMRAEIHTLKRPPYSCIVDGVQLTSGCTLGKGNICIREDQKLCGIFVKDSRKIEIRVTPEIVEILTNLSGDIEDCARTLFAKEDDELFEVVS
jgi:formylmethanofuran dehydrogenase subunit E